jgi:maltose phosphorylase
MTTNTTIQTDVILKKYLTADPWCIIEEKFDQNKQRSSESIFSLGNGHMGQRANLEEKYSGDSAHGEFISGIYYPDPTKVGWWKNGYPLYFAKTVNLPRWVGIEVNVGTTGNVDLATCKILEFKRTLNMREGYLERFCVVELQDGKQLKILSQRFISMANKEIGAIKYSVTPLNFSADIIFTIDIDADIKNESSYYNEYFLDELNREAATDEAYIEILTRKTFFNVCTGTKFKLLQNGVPIETHTESFNSEKYVGSMVKVHCAKDSTTTIYKYAAILSSLNHEPTAIFGLCRKALHTAYDTGFETLLKEHSAIWAKKWEQSDIVIEGDIEAQQAIRFNIFQLNQTYTGDDPRLNIGPKGFTGEKYGGVTYWDTEAFCFPFYMCSASPEVAKNLLLYRYKHLPRAIENGAKLGFKNGAALYPMVTINGEECHNEWEITFEEIHRNGAIAYAIYSYVNYTGDKDYLAEYGLEVLIALSRFWSQRANYSDEKKKYVILGVTGPNEYENNVSNNWYTNTIAVWTLKYTLEGLAHTKKTAKEKYSALIAKTHLDEHKELHHWQEIIEKMYFPTDKERGIFLQQDGYMDKEQIMAKDLDPHERPINQHWSWDRILRSCFIKQADVLQGIYFFENQFSKKEIKQNFDFYEPRTVHESSLSASTHAIIAAHIDGYLEKAYEMYLRATRLDLDDYNNEVKEGCHITSMGGSWAAIVQGFAGMKVLHDKLHIDPALPKQWQSYTFKLLFRGSLIKVKVAKDAVELHNESNHATEIVVHDKPHKLAAQQHTKINN